MTSRARSPAPGSRRSRGRRRSIPAPRASSPSTTARMTAPRPGWWRSCAWSCATRSAPRSIPIRRRRGDPRLAVLAPAALRLIADPGARVHALGGNEARETARRLATLAAGRRRFVMRVQVADAGRGRRPVGVHAAVRPRAVRGAGPGRRRGAGWSRAGSRTATPRRCPATRSTSASTASRAAGPARVRGGPSRRSSTCPTCSPTAARSAADVVHFQWLTMQWIDGHLLPRAVPVVLTSHDLLPREPRPGQARGAAPAVRARRRGRRPLAVRPRPAGRSRSASMPAAST